MTCHRLIPGTTPDLLAGAVIRSRTASELLPCGTGLPWFTRGGPAGSRAVWWRQHYLGSLVGGTLDWFFEIEPNASGVLAHLTARPQAGRGARPAPLSTTVLRAWTGHELAALAHLVE